MRVVKLTDLYEKFAAIRPRAVARPPVEEMDDYPEPPDAKWVCAYCGKKTRDEPTLIDDEERRQTILYKTCCARRACLDASEVDPDFRVTYAFGHRPS